LKAAMLKTGFLHEEEEHFVFAKLAPKAVLV
jgi:hypothetical protein